MHEQKFKDPLSSTCQVSSERGVLDLESDVLGSILNGGNILSLYFFLFLHSKAFDANIGIIANVVCFFAGYYCLKIKLQIIEYPFNGEYFCWLV